MMNPNRKRGDNANGDEDDDRKPPAKEIVLKNSKMKAFPSSSTNEGTGNETSPGSRATFTTHPTSTETSVASSSSSFSAPSRWVSPVARLHPPGRVSNRRATPGSSIKKTVPSTDARNRVPSLMAATPCPMSPSETEPIVSNAMSSTSTLRRLYRLATLWLVTVFMAGVVFVYQVLPNEAFAALLFILASTGMMTQTVYTTFRQWYYETVVTGPGLGQLLLPRSLYQTLTETTLHEYMTNPSFGIDNGHLLLYFLPLSPEQLQGAIQRLAPLHQERLHRRGLGHIVLGEGMMRILLGEPRYRDIEQLHQRAPGTATAEQDSTIENAPGPLQPSHRPLLLLSDEGDEDDASDLGLDVSVDDMVGGLNEQQAHSFVRRLGLDAGVTSTSTPARTPLPSQSIGDTPSSDINRDSQVSNPDLPVIIDALWASFYGSIWNPMQDYVSTSLIRPTVRTANRWATRVVLFSSTVTLGGFGLSWWVGGVDNARTLLPSLVTSLTRSIAPIGSTRGTGRDGTMMYFPHLNSWHSAFIGGASTGLALFAFHQVRRSWRDPSATPPTSGTKASRKESDKK